MKRILALAFTLVASGCGPFAVGSGYLVEEPRDLPPFSAVELHDGFYAEIVTGYEQDVLVVADDNLIDLVRTRVRDGKLEVQVEHGVPIDAHLEIRIAVPALERLDLSGGSQAYASGLREHALAVSLSGGSEATLRGSCDSLLVEQSGGSELHARGLFCRNGTLELSGGSRAFVAVSDDLTVEASGGSQVRCAGYPFVRLDLSGGSTFETF